MTTQTDTTYQRFESESNAQRRLLRQEELILEVTEALLQAMDKAGVTQAELAQRLGKTRGFISQVLAGGRNLTLRTIADFADALDERVRVQVCDQGGWLNSTLREQARETVVWTAA